MAIFTPVTSGSFLPSISTCTKPSTSMTLTLATRAPLLAQQPQFDVPLHRVQHLADRVVAAAEGNAQRGPCGVRGKNLRAVADLRLDSSLRPGRLRGFQSPTVQGLERSPHGEQRRPCERRGAGRGALRASRGLLLDYKTVAELAGAH